jgi:chromosome segregation ATPase
MPLTVEQLSISLDEEREKIVAIQRKHSNNIKDLQRQVQLYSKRIEQLESSCQSDVATLPIMETDYHSAAGLASYRSNSFGSLMGDSMNNVHVLTLPSSDNNRMPSPEEMPLITQSHSFKNLDSEKTVLVEKLCQLQRNLAKKEDKLEFYESHCHQLMEDIKQKSKYFYWLYLFIGFTYSKSNF